MAKKSPEEYVLDIQDACKELGWQISMCAQDKGIRGLVIGQSDYVEEIVDQLDNVDDYEVYEFPDESADIH